MGFQHSVYAFMFHQIHKKMDNGKQMSSSMSFELLATQD
jgi:hypothetical protein